MHIKIIKSPLTLFVKEGHYSSLWQREVRRDFTNPSSDYFGHINMWQQSAKLPYLLLDIRAIIERCFNGQKMGRKYPYLSRDRRYVRRFVLTPEIWSFFRMFFR
jgi:hypothetical protein